MIGSVGGTPGDAIRVEPGFCRVCLGYCGINVTVENGRATKVKGDPSSPLTGGFTCVKGRSIPEQLSRPDRVLSSLRRDASGSFVKMGSREAALEVADRLGELVERYGPRSVALYLATGSSGHATAMPTAHALWRAIGSPMIFNPGPIDQPGKTVAAALHGRWAGGAWTPAEADVWTFVGTNPLVTMWAGTNMSAPAGILREGRERGMKVVVIDPRRSEMTSFADVHLAVRPGEDPSVLAALVRLLLDSGAHDSDFVARYAVGLEVLREAVDPFTVDVAASRAGVSPSDLERAAEIMAVSRTGGISAGTGPNMSRWGSLTEYLVLAVQTLCGYWRREGDPLANPGVLIAPQEWREQPAARGDAEFMGGFVPDRGEGVITDGFRYNGEIVESAAGLQTGHVADDILGDAHDRIRALVNVGGNPLVAWPEESKVRAALERLDLLVTLDVDMSATAEVSDIVIGTKFHLETSNITAVEGIRGFGAACEGFPLPFAMYMPPLSVPPEGSDLVEEWQVFHAVARRLDLPLIINGIDLAASDDVSGDDVLGALLKHAVVSLDELRSHPRGNVFESAAVVGPCDPDLPSNQRLRLGERSVLNHLTDVLAENQSDAPFRLVVRRTKQMKNSWGSGLPSIDKWFPHANPAWINPDDAASLGVTTGDHVDIRSEAGHVRCVVEEDASLRPGVVSVSHGWGGGDRTGTNVNRLTSSRSAADPISAIPLMSAIPVWLERVATRCVQSTEGDDQRSGI